MTYAMAGSSIPNWLPCMPALPLMSLSALPVCSTPERCLTSGGAFLLCMPTQVLECSTATYSACLGSAVK